MGIQQQRHDPNSDGWALLAGANLLVVSLAVLLSLFAPPVCLIGFWFGD
jgi:hypothetical protein